MPKSLGKSISPSTGRRLVISDIHGCYATLTTLLDRLEIQQSDQVFFLGDYISKGPECKKTLDFILHLNSLPNYFVLLGNHDDLFLEYLQTGSESLEEKLIELGNSDLLELTDNDVAYYQNELSNLYSFFDIGPFLLVHAGFDFSLINPFESKVEMLNIRQFGYNSEKAGNKTIIHGHFPHEKDKIEKAIASQDKIIPLDNGCVYLGNRENMGELLCLELDTMILHSQIKID